MPTNLPHVNVQTSLGHTVQRIINHSKENEFATSKDVKVTRTGYGSSIRLSDELKNFPTFFLAYRGEFDANKYYARNDVVRVPVTSTTATPGIWVCVYEVPDKQISDKLKVMDSSAYAKYIRSEEANYNPVWPEPTATPSKESPAGKYWELISMLPVEVAMCVNNETKTYYVPMVESGSISV